MGGEEERTKSREVLNRRHNQRKTAKNIYFFCFPEIKMINYSHMNFIFHNYNYQISFIN